MKYITAITAFAAVAVSSVQAGCFSGGDAWPDLEGVLNKAKEACGGDLIGSFGPSGGSQSSKSKCYDIGGKKVEFILTHISDGDRNIDSGECYDGIQKEINGCDHGGESSYDNWKYKADPNSGSC